MSNNEIILYKEEEATALTLYRNDGLDPFIENIRKVAEEFEADVTTEKGRKAYKSLAYKISRAKTKVDEVRQAENEEHYAAIKTNNEKGNKAVAELQAIQDEVKEPVTQWEKRIKEHQQAIKDIEEVAVSISTQWESASIEQMGASLEGVRSESRDWQEFSFKAENVKKKAIEDIEAAIAKRKKHDADKLELERLQKAEEERKQKERDEAIAKEAAERARIAAEQKAEAEKKAEIAKAAKLKKEAEERELRLKQEKERAENEKKEAEERAKRAEQAAIEAEEKAKIDKQKAEEAAKLKEIEDAKRREAERQKLIADLQRRADEEKAAEAAKIAKRKADEEHKKKIILEAENALVNVEGFSHRLSSSVIQAIIEGKISHVTFNY